MIEIITKEFLKKYKFTEREDGFFGIELKTEDVHLFVNLFGHVWIEYIYPSIHKDQTVDSAIGIGQYTETQLEQLIISLKNCN